METHPHGDSTYSEPAGPEAPPQDVLSERHAWIWAVCQLTEQFDARPDQTERATTRFRLNHCPAELDCPPVGLLKEPIELFDISSNGIGFATDREFTPGTVILLRFPDASTLTRWSFVVRWCHRQEDGRFRCGALLAERWTRTRSA